MYICLLPHINGKGKVKYEFKTKDLLTAHILRLSGDERKQAEVYQAEKLDIKIEVHYGQILDGESDEGTAVGGSRSCDPGFYQRDRIRTLSAEEQAGGVEGSLSQAG
jgi:hypothetical protein